LFAYRATNITRERQNMGRAVEAEAGKWGEGSNSAVTRAIRDERTW
jgi:DNA invertase Pin-like site-specific DNA recombinase